MTPPVLRLLVADDHQLVRMGIVAMLEQEPSLRVIAQADTGDEAIRLYQAERPDVCIMDLRMPGANGFEAIRAIRRDHPDAKILVLTTYEGNEDIHQALASGAVGYVLKSVDAPDLIEAVRCVARGERYLPAGLNQRLVERDSATALSPREVEVLDLLAKGLSNKEIADVLGCTERTTKFHLGNILGKLGVEDRTQAVAEAVHRGFIHIED